MFAVGRLCTVWLGYGIAVGENYDVRWIDGWQSDVVAIRSSALLARSNGLLSLQSSAGDLHLLSHTLFSVLAARLSIMLVFYY